MEENILILLIAAATGVVYIVMGLFLGEADTNSDKLWRLGEKDPLRRLLYKDKQLRLWVKPVLLITGMVLILGVLSLVLFAQDLPK